VAVVLTVHVAVVEVVDVVLVDDGVVAAARAVRVVVLFGLAVVDDGHGWFSWVCWKASRSTWATCSSVRE